MKDFSHVTNQGLLTEEMWGHKRLYKYIIFGASMQVKIGKEGRAIIGNRTI